MLTPRAVPEKGDSRTKWDNAHADGGQRARAPSTARGSGRGEEVVVKRGAHGAASFTADGTTDRAARQVDAVDLAGAGDAFVAGYLSAHLHGADIPARHHRGLRRRHPGRLGGPFHAGRTRPVRPARRHDRPLTQETEHDFNGSTGGGRRGRSLRTRRGGPLGRRPVRVRRPPQRPALRTARRHRTGGCPPTGTTGGSLGRGRAGGRSAGRMDRRCGHRHRSAHPRRRPGMAGPPRGPHPGPQPDERRRHRPRRPLLGGQYGLRRDTWRGLAVPNGP